MLLEKIFETEAQQKVLLRIGFCLLQCFSCLLLMFWLGLAVGARQLFGMAGRRSDILFLTIVINTAELSVCLTGSHCLSVCLPLPLSLSCSLLVSLYFCCCWCNRNNNDCIGRFNLRFLQSLHCTTNYLQHIRSCDQGAVVCKSRAAHWALITCSMSCATWCKGTAQLLSLTQFKLHLSGLYFIGWNH